MGFGDASLIRTLRNTRTINPKVVVAEVKATRTDTPICKADRDQARRGTSMAFTCPVTLDTRRLGEEVEL